MSSYREKNNNLYLPLLMLGSAAGGAAILWGWQQLTRVAKKTRNEKPADAEKDYDAAHELVWASIAGAMNSAMMFTGDKLKLYETIRRLCQEPGSSTTAVELAKETGYKQRWLREWLAQQAGAGVLKLAPGTGDDDASLRYRLPFAAGEVLGNPESPHYDISLVHMVPALVNRARTMLPEAFTTGIGRPYDDPDVAEAIDRHHTVSVRDKFLPFYLPKAMNGKVLEMLQNGCQVADLGCGAGILLVSLARQFPKSKFHGFEISTVAIEKASFNVASARLSNCFLHDANVPGEQLGDRPNQFDVAIVYDVLHDSTHPADLVQQVVTSLKKTNGVFLCGDIPCKPTVRENLAQLPAPGTYYGFSACLCMSCALSTADGAGMGTLGFSVPVATKMLADKGFRQVEILAEDTNSRWFLAYGLAE